LHGFTGRADKNFIPWLAESLRSKGYDVQAPQLPNTDAPTQEEQVGFVLENCQLDENTIIIAHSLGSAVAMKALESIDKPIQRLVLVAPVIEPEFNPHDERSIYKTFKFDYDFDKVRQNARQRVILSDDLEMERRGPYLE
jgi:predicted alpha/beta hydrolase family esterase